MTQETAEKVRDLLNHRDKCQEELDEILRCDGIKGTIVTRNGGKEFKWCGSDHCLVQFLKSALEDEIRKIDAQIQRM